MRTYTQLTRPSEKIRDLYAVYPSVCTYEAGHNQTDIASLIKVHISTIRHEIRRNHRLKSYRPKQAHRFALNRCKKARYRIKASTWILIEALIRQERSSEQVAHWRKENYALQIIHDWIYQYILMDEHPEQLHTYDGQPIVSSAWANI